MGRDWGRAGAPANPPLFLPSSRDGVDVRYRVDATTPSGTCAVAVKGGERSLVANLAAANNYKVRVFSLLVSFVSRLAPASRRRRADTRLFPPQIDHLKEPAQWALVDAARVCYSAGFFLTVAPDAIQAVAEHCSAAGKTYCLNISAPFLVQVPPFKAAMMAAMPHVDVLFGNETEARAFAESEGWAAADLPTIARMIAALPKATGTRCRTVVITQGADPIDLENGRTHAIPVIPLAPRGPCRHQWRGRRVRGRLPVPAGRRQRRRRVLPRRELCGARHHPTVGVHPAGVAGRLPLGVTRERDKGGGRGGVGRHLPLSGDNAVTLAITRTTPLHTLNAAAATSAATASTSASGSKKTRRLARPGWPRPPSGARPAPPGRPHRARPGRRRAPGRR